ncbi:MAG: glycoside hydrolase 5 family protein [Thermodesulfobacteriota bacterium]
MKDEFVIGVNYWPIESAMDWWHRFDAGAVKEDFSKIQEIGLSSVRVFLIWEDFQPLPKKISLKALDQLVAVMDIGHEKRLRIMPTLFTGHMSGMNYLPPWMLELSESDDRFPVFSEGRKMKNAIRNFYVDREVIEAQKLLVREVSGALQGHPALWAWDLGNEPSNLCRPPSCKEASAWLEEMVSELKKRDETVPVTLGLHQEDLEEDRRMGPKEVAAFCDFLSMHAYSIYARWADGLLDEHVVPFLALLTRWLGSKKVMIEEVGVSSSNLFKEAEATVSEERAFEYFERLLPKLTRCGFLGVLFWCYGDYARPLWEQAPFDQKMHERHFGLFREDRSPKAFVPLLKNLQDQTGTDSVSFDWIDIEPEQYYQSSFHHLSRLYRRFKERAL